MVGAAPTTVGVAAVRRLSSRLTPLRSLRNRLVVLFFGITFIAFGSLYLYISPGLRSRLERQRLSALADAASRYAPPIGQALDEAIPGSASVQELVASASRRSGDRVTVLEGPGALVSIADSSSPLAARPLRFPAAAAVARAGRPATAIEGSSAGAGKVAEAAVPVAGPGGRVLAVVVVSAPLSDVPSTVALVKHEVLVAGGIALLIALVLGTLVARALAQRVKRIERAAEQMAAGDFAHPIAVDSDDELGQLAAAFNDMQRQVAQLDTARKQFIATASHELRTPLFSLGGFVELLEDEDLDPETRRRFLDQVRDQVERLRKLSVDLLDLSKLEAGSLELRPQSVDIGELARSVSGEFEPALALQDAHLELRMSRRTIEAVCDPVRVAQIMRILIDNALVHTPRGARIVVTAARDDGRVRLAVRDDGYGIDQAVLGRIFEPFFTADDQQGSGLGLAIASELAERMRGRLSVDSRPGWTVFTLEIPA